MSRPVKIIGTVVLVLALIAGVTGIAYATAQSGGEEETQAGLYVDGKRVDDPGVILTVGDVEIPFAEYYYYYMMNKSYTEMFNGGAAIWDADYDGAHEMDLQNNTDDTIIDMYAWLAVAEDRGITLTDEEKQEVQDTLAEQKETLGDGFDENLKSMYLADEDMYVRVTEQQKLASKAEDAVRAEEEAKVADTADMEPDTEGVVSAKHILISFDEEAEDPAADEADAKARADELVAQIRAAEADEGADVNALFDQLIAEYGEDPGMESNPEGYTFGEGEMVDEFYNGTLALAEGEVSDPIRTDYGYHIIMRLPLSDAYLEEQREGMREDEISTLVDAVLAEQKEAMPVGYGEHYSDVSPQTMK